LPFEEGDELFKAFDIAQLDPVFIYSPNTPLKTSRKGHRNAQDISRQHLVSHMNAAPGANLSMLPGFSFDF